MNRSEFDRKLAEQLNEKQKEVMNVALMQATHRECMQQLAVVVTTVSHESSIHFYPMNKGAGLRVSITLWREQTFKIFERIANALDLLGFPVETWKTKDGNSAYKHRVFTFDTDLVEINLDIWLSDDAACELVEKERIPQPDKIIYELRCGDDKS